MYGLWWVKNSIKQTNTKHNVQNCTESIVASGEIGKGWLFIELPYLEKQKCMKVYKTKAINSILSQTEVKELLQ